MGHTSNQSRRFRLSVWEVPGQWTFAWPDLERKVGIESSMGLVDLISGSERVLGPNPRGIQPARNEELLGLIELDASEGGWMTVLVLASERITPPNRSVSAK